MFGRFRGRAAALIVALALGAPLVSAVTAAQPVFAAPIRPDPCLTRASSALVTVCKPGNEGALHPLGARFGRHGQQIDYGLLRDGHVPPSGSESTDPLLAAVQVKNGLASVGSTWAGLGPAPIVYSGSTYTDTGRVLALAYQQATNTLYLGSADGGVWKTTNSGSSWTALTDAMPSLSVDALALDPSHPQTIFAGTGETAYCIDCLYGVGIYKSTDGGSSWSLYGNSVFQRNVVSSIVVDPSNSNYVFAGVINRSGGNVGVAVSSDGGQAWTVPAATSVSGHNVTDLAIDASGDVYAALSGTTNPAANGIYRSTDHGQSWTAVSTGLPTTTGDQFKLALDQNTASNGLSNQNLYTIVGDGQQATSGHLLGVYRTTNGGGSWTQIAQPTTVASYEAQAWYDIYIAVDPRDATGNTVYFGLSDIYKTTTALSGAPQWTNLTCVYGGCPTAANMHPDQHTIAFVGGTTYFGNDGGVYKSSNGGSSFSAANGNLALSQFYGGALGTGATASRLLGGLQDNGTVESNGGSWTSPVGGDGMQTAIDYSNNQNMYGEYENGTTFSTHNGTNWVQSTSGLNLNESVNWSAPLAIDPTTPQTLYSGRTHLYRTTNGEGSWTNISPGLSLSHPISAIGVSKSDPNTIYIGDFNGHLWATHDGGSTWNPLDGASCDPSHPSPYWCSNGGITSIAVDPTNSQTIYVTENAFEGAQKLHVFKTTDGGTTWNDISTSLPDLPFQSVAISPNATGTIYASADIGVYVSLDGGSTWSTLGTGLPNVSVYQVVMSADGASLVAFTHGRGAWRIPALNSNLPGVPTGLSLTPGNAQIQATWSSPGSNGGSAIDRYSVSITDGASFNQTQQITNLNILAATFTGLANGTAYTVSVSAHNAAGLGLPATATAVPSSVPDKVTGVTATAGYQQATLGWTAPGNEGSALTGYLVDCEPGGHQPASPPAGSATSAVVPNLTGGTQYTCTVAGVNANGTGAASDPVNVTPIDLPGAPTSLSLTPGNEAIKATWNPPASNGGASIDRYDAGITDGHGFTATQQITNLSSLSATFTGLTNGTTYTVSVSAHTSAGSGPAATGTATPSGVSVLPGQLVVTSTDDTASCPGGPANPGYTLRCAINQANIDGSGDTILFDIPSLDPNCHAESIQGSTVSECTIAPQSSLPALTASSTTIDGYSQPGAAKNTLSAGTGDNAILTVTINNTTGCCVTLEGAKDAVHGLSVINGNDGISFTASNAVISGNFVGVAPNGTAAGNYHSGVTWAWNGAWSQDVTIGGRSPADANVISGNGVDGVEIGYSTSDTVEGNYIGTDPTAAAAMANGWNGPAADPNYGTAGILVVPSSNDELGGTAAGAANIIAGNNGPGIELTTVYSNTDQVQGNYIGTNAAGTPLGNTGSGVYLSSGASSDLIGGSAGGAANVIANNAGSGVLVGSSPTDAAHAVVSENSMFANQHLGIALGTSSTITCSGPVSGAPNDDLPCPVIAAATPSQLSGTAPPGSVVELFLALAGNGDSGHGEGQTYLTSVTADSSGTWHAAPPYGASVTLGSLLTASATSTLNNGETSEFAANVMVSSVPGAPGDVSAAAGDGQATVGWSAANANDSPVTGYQASCARTSDGLDVHSTSVDGSTLTATVTGLTDGTQYTCSVTATNVNGTGPAGTASPVLPNGKPAAPTNVAATPGDQQIVLTWSAANAEGSSVTGYTATCKRTTDGGGGQSAPPVNGTTLTATVTNLVNGTQYTCSVTATNANGTGPAGTASPVTPSTLPGPPGGVQATRGDAKATLTWTAANANGSAITGYTATCSRPSDTHSAPVGGATLTATIAGLTNGAQYSCSVTATNGNGAGPPSSPVVTVTPSTVPGQPSITQTSVTATSIALTWTTPASNGGAPILSYTAVCTPSGGGVAISVVTDAATFSTTVGGLTTGTTYTCSVSAANINGATASNPVTLTPSTVPDQPTSFSATAGDTTASLSWTGPANTGGLPITGWVITVYLQGSNTPLSPQPPVSTPSCDSSIPAHCTAAISGLTDNTAHTVTIAAQNGNGPGPVASANVTPTNPLPTLAVAGNTTVAYGSPLSVTVTLSDTDNDPLLVSASGLPATFKVTTTSGSGDSKIVTITGTGKNSAASATPGQYALSVTYGDGKNPSQNQQVPIVITKQLVTMSSLTAAGIGVASDTALTGAQTFTATIKETWFGATTGTPNPIAANTPFTITATRLVTNGSNAGTATITAPSGSGTTALTCSATVATAVAPGPYTLTARCSNFKLPVGVYDLHLAVAGSSSYYTGSYDIVFTVYNSAATSTWKDYGYGAVSRVVSSTVKVPASFGFLNKPCSLAGSSSPAGGMVYIEHRTVTSGTMTSQGIVDVIVHTTALASCKLAGTTVKTATIVGTASRSDDPGSPYVLQVVATGGTAPRLGVSVYGGSDALNLGNDSPTEINFSSTPVALSTSPAGRIATG